MTPIITTNQKPTIDTHKLERSDTSIPLRKTTKLQGKKLKEKNREPKNNQKIGNDHFKYQWTKCSNQKTYCGGLD